MRRRTVPLNLTLRLLPGSAGAGHLPLFPDGVLPGGGPVLLQLPENLPLDHQRLQAAAVLLLQGNQSLGTGSDAVLL